MASTTITLSVDSRPLLKQIHDVAWLLQYVPRGRARTLYRKLLTLLDSRDLYQVTNDKRLPTGRAANYVVRLRVLGMDELLAAAFRAAKFRGKADFGHVASPWIDLVHLTAAALAGGGKDQGARNA